MNDERQCCKCGDYHPLRRMEAKPSRDDWHTLYTCNVCAAMTATPSAAEQAATWVIENPPSRAMGRYTYGRDGYLAGHAAGEVAGAERERARVCVWAWSKSGRGVVNPHSGDRMNDPRDIGEVRCPFCGGRIEVKP